MSATQTGRNRLAHEASPYLLLHADNPVDWYPWGREAFEAARLADKPIFLSIGYSTCYWCHVMERESFADEGIGALLSEAFVCIKVDREERPDLDEQYMQAVQLMTGSGGWPMTVMLTPDLKPFFGGTYYPPDQLRRVVGAIGEIWRTDRARLLTSADELVAAMARGNRFGATNAERLTGDDLGQALQAMLTDQDAVHGGHRGAPKFPQDQSDTLFLSAWHHGGPAAFRDAALRSLDAMALGGIHDHVGGGFHRYSTDGMWQVPHFEKMLYNQAGLLRAYSDAAALTGSWWYRRVAAGIVRFTLNELRDPQTGAFWSALDAETDGHEGLHYLWSEADLQQPAASTAYPLDELRLTPVPDPHGHQPHDATSGVLSLRQRPASPGDADALAALCSLLKGRRDRRPRVMTDDKVIASWNGLMISALARAGCLLAEPAWVETAERAATFALAHLRGPDGELRHVWRGGRVGGTAFSEDYAALGVACLDLHHATGAERWQREAASLAQTLCHRYSADDGGFHAASATADDLLMRNKPLFDNAVPSANSLAAELLFRLAEVDSASWLAKARGVLAALGSLARKYPHGLATLLRVAHDEDLDTNAGARPVWLSVQHATDHTALTVCLRAGWQTEQLTVTDDQGQALTVTRTEQPGPSRSVLHLADRLAPDALASVHLSLCGHGRCLPATVLTISGDPHQAHH